MAAGFVVVDIFDFQLVILNVVNSDFVVADVVIWLI